MEKVLKVEKNKPKVLKILLYIFLGLVVFVVIAAAGFPLYSNHLAGKEYPQKIDMVQASQPSGQKMLIVYQPSSNSGFSEEVAHKIAEGASEQGIDVTLMRPTADPSIDAASFDIMVFGTPWYLQPSKKLLEFMGTLQNPSEKKIGLFITAGGQNEPSMFEPLEKALGIESASNKHVFGYKDYTADKAIEFGRQIGEK